MTPDEIRQFIQNTYQDIRIDERHNPDGWSFFCGGIKRGPKSTRIARVVTGRRGRANEFKLSVTSRLDRRESLCEITSEEQLRELFDQELSLWFANFGQSADCPNA